MKFVVEFNCDNAAFEGEYLYQQIAATLQDIARKVFFNEKTEQVIRDLNGNKIGRCELLED